MKRLLGVPAGLPVLRVLQASRVRAGVALHWHAVGYPAGNPRTELVPNLPTALFERQLHFLNHMFQLVRASDLPEAAGARKPGHRFPVAMTFDDDLASHERVVLPLLARHRAPVTFFLTGAGLEAPAWFWFNAVDALTRARRGPPDPVRLARSMQLLEPARRDAATKPLLAAAGPPPADAGLRAEAVRALAAAGHEIGFHTRAHEPLPTVDDDALARALVEGRAELAAAASAPIETIAYPHGQIDARTAAAARTAGYRAGFTLAECAITPRDDRMLLGRYEAPPTSVGHLAFVVARALLAAALEA